MVILERFIDDDSEFYLENSPALAINWIVQENYMNNVLKYEIRRGDINNVTPAILIMTTIGKEIWNS